MMKKIVWRFLSCFFVFGILCIIPIKGSANSAEPPCFTVIVRNAPKDLMLSVESIGGDAFDSLELDPPDTQAQESYYRFRHFLYDPQLNLQEAVLRVSYEGVDYTCAFPKECSKYYNGLLILNLKDRSLRMEASTGRSFLLVTLRIALTLFLEGLVFFLFGYRKKGSWLLFLITNFFTQIGLNFLLMDVVSSANGYMRILFLFYLFGEALVFFIELLVFVLRLREFSKARAALCALTANAVSLILGGLCLTYLPLAYLPFS